MAGIRSKLVVGLALLGASYPAFTDPAAPDLGVLRQWVQEMKEAPKGPFERVRWFCKDGSVLPPEPYACREHGGGRQHGEWSDRAKVLRSAGYYVGNVLAAVDAQRLAASRSGRYELRQLLLERFLIQTDDGWIFRRAASYRGALQFEDELEGARRILKALVQSEVRVKQAYLLERMAAQVLPRQRAAPTVTEVRDRSTDLAEMDPGFVPLRDKIHTQPDPGDAKRIRAYMQEQGMKALWGDYEHLARSIDRLYESGDIADRLREVAGRTRHDTLEIRLQEAAEHLVADQSDAEARFLRLSELLGGLRRWQSSRLSVEERTALLELSLDLERAAFTAGTRLLERLGSASRQVRLRWLRAAAEAVYGQGFLTDRQARSINDSLERLQTTPVLVERYRTELRYLTRVPEWANAWLAFHFGAAIEHLARIEPKIHGFIPEQLRSGPLLVLTRILESLLADADRLADMKHVFFDDPVALGLRPLNPGLARGRLHVSTPGSNAGFDPRGIYLLPSTTAELPPVAGILTLGEGNALSHVQLLAANLGIPNVVVNRRLAARLRSHAGQRVELTVSPGGRVRLVRDPNPPPKIDQAPVPEGPAVIGADLDKLDLSVRDLMPLSRLRAKDAGRIAGPKAANLGELRHRLPDHVPPGLVIPFGVFRQQLERPLPDSNQTLFEWIRSEYERLNQIDPGPERMQATRELLAELRRRIQGLDPGETFRSQLRQALERSFGSDEDYSLFVRSDTNVEDLPGFTGAGLNLTVPNVRGFDPLLEAIARVWASPFTERAFSWRQQRMERPEHVYVSILLMPSVAVDRSGVMVTADPATGERDWLTVAANEGVGGAVAGQAAEELEVHMRTGRLRLLNEATATTRRVLAEDGGLRRLPVSADPVVLSEGDLQRLLVLARQLPQRFPQFDAHGKPAPADIEFGFAGDRLVLFQVRPFVRSAGEAESRRRLAEMDRGLEVRARRVVDLDAVPEE